jgi:hypothetical protein
LLVVVVLLSNHSGTLDSLGPFEFDWQLVSDLSAGLSSWYSVPSSLNLTSSGVTERTNWRWPSSKRLGKTISRPVVFETGIS